MANIKTPKKVLNRAIVVDCRLVVVDEDLKTNLDLSFFPKLFITLVVEYICPP